MTEPMLQFVTVPQQMPQKRSAADRCQDFEEIYEGLQAREASKQASRCSQCGVPFCSVHCPLGNNIPDWLMLTATGRLKEAYELSSDTNSFPEICGRICPQDRLCEGNCVIESGFSAVTIGAVEKFLTETAFAQGWVKPRIPIYEQQQSVGIIGAGPAGLAAAERLRMLGYQVHVYDRHDRVGGLLVYGIPSFKLDKAVVARRHHLLSAQGVHFHLSTEIGSRAGQLPFADLRARHDAIFIATGVYRAREATITGAGHDGVIQALAYLTASNARGYDQNRVVDAHLHAKGRRVVVIGGGDTAMDCVRTAIRQGAAAVTCVYRRDRENMPGSAQEVRNAEEENVKFIWLSAPKAILGQHRVEGLIIQKMRLGALDSAGRRDVEAVDGDVTTIDADLIILALGFEPEDLPLHWDTPNLRVTRQGTILAPLSTYETSLPGVFAGGDIVRGASLVVWAIRDGQEAAEAIQAYLVSHQDKLDEKNGAARHRLTVGD